MRLSPDNRHAVATVLNGSKKTREIWLYDIGSGAGTRFVFGKGDNWAPTWSPDGTRIFFGSDRKKHEQNSDVWVKAVDGSSEESYFETQDLVEPRDWSTDGRYLALDNIPLVGKRNNEIWVLNAADTQHPNPFAQAQTLEATSQERPRFSPDGKWIAYESDESGTFEVYVRPFPGTGGKRKVSTAGGKLPSWRRDGRELFYFALDNRLMAVPVSVAPTFEVGKPAPLFPIYAGPNGAVYDSAADGQRFLVATAPESSGSPPLTMLLNWTALLKKP
jgi:Tol biopolymer transport system component